MAKRRFPSPSATRYDARGTWDNGTLSEYFATELVRAIIRDGGISLEWPLHDGEKAETNLTSTDGYRYTGHSIWAPGTKDEQKAVVEAVLYSNKIGHVLVGEEKWSSGIEDWFVVQFSNGQPVSLSD